MNVLRGVRALLVLVLGLGTLTCWWVRFSNDLSWDEALNLRSYSRHILTSLALYREPNNHVFETTFKSLFHWGLGLDQPPLWRLPALILVLLYLGLVVGIYRSIEKAGAPLAATLCGGLMLCAVGPFEQGMVMRGYFLSILLGFFYGWMLLCRAGFLEPLNSSPALSPKISWSRRERWRFSVVLALILWTVPSNILLVPGFFPATVLAFAGMGRTPESSAKYIIRETFYFGLTTGVMTALLYSPIFVGLGFGFYSLHLIPTQGGETALGTMFVSLKILVEQSLPGHFRATFGGAALAALVVSSLPFLFRGDAWRRSAVRAAVAALTVAFVLPLLLAGIVEYPGRTKSPVSAVLIVSMTLIVFALTRTWTRRVQDVLAIILLCGFLAGAKETVESEKVERVASDFAAHLESLTQPSTRTVLVAHDDLLPLYFPLRSRFGADHIINGRVEMVRTFEAENRFKDHPEGSFKRRLRDMFFPKTPRRVFNPDEVDCLVLVNNLYRPAAVSPLLWRHFALDTLKEKLPLRKRWTWGDFEFEIFERAAGPESRDNPPR